MTTEEEKNKGGRPTKYTEKLADLVCEFIIIGWSVKKICELPEMPDIASIFRWLNTRPEFRDKYEKAKVLQADFLAEDIIDIADGTSGDVSRDKLRVDTRKWVASKYGHKKYGDKVQQQITGVDGGPIKTLDAVAASKLSKEELKALELLLAKLEGGGDAAS